MKKATLINKGYLGFHLVLSSGKAYNGHETPFNILETRAIDSSKVKLCYYGYHWTKLPSDCAIHYNFGPVIEFCLFSPPLDTEDRKYVSSSKMVIATANIRDLKNKFTDNLYNNSHISSIERKKFNASVYKALGLKLGRGE